MQFKRDITFAFKQKNINAKVGCLLLSCFTVFAPLGYYCSLARRAAQNGPEETEVDSVFDNFSENWMKGLSYSVFCIPVILLLAGLQIYLAMNELGSFARIFQLISGLISMFWLSAAIIREVTLKEGESRFDLMGLFSAAFSDVKRLLTLTFMNILFTAVSGLLMWIIVVPLGLGAGFLVALIFGLYNSLDNNPVVQLLVVVGCIFLALLGLCLVIFACIVSYKISISYACAAGFYFYEEFSVERAVSRMNSENYQSAAPAAADNQPGSIDIDTQWKDY